MDEKISLGLVNSLSFASLWASNTFLICSPALANRVLRFLLFSSFVGNTAFSNTLVSNCLFSWTRSYSCFISAAGLGLSIDWLSAVFVFSGIKRALCSIYFFFISIEVHTKLINRYFSMRSSAKRTRTISTRPCRNTNQKQAFLSSRQTVA